MANTFSSDSYRPAKTLSYFVIGLLAFQIFGSVLFIVFAFGLMVYPDWALKVDTGPDVPFFYLAIGLVSILEIVVRIATIVLLLVWEYRSFANLSPLKARNLEYSPGWAVGWWFIPFANLVKPYQVMSELWRESDPDFDEDLGYLAASVSAPAILGFWWAFWIIANIFDRFLQRTEPELGGDLKVFSFMLLITAVLSISAAGLLIFVVRDITSRQDERFKKIGVLRSDLPPPPPVF